MDTMEATERGLHVGELARRAGLSAPTVRFYEREGLLAPPRRSQAGYRVYEPAALADLRFIARAKALGLSLDQIKLLRSAPDAAAERRQLRHLLAHQLIETRRRRADLDALEVSLTRLFAALMREPGPCDCPPEGCDAERFETAAATAELAQETARIESAACSCACALDPGCSCGCPCCSLEQTIPDPVAEMRPGRPHRARRP